MTEATFAARVFAALRALPLINTGLLLGAAAAASAGLIWIIWLLGHKSWGKAVSVLELQINSLTIIAGGLITVVLVVVFTLAWGKPGKVSFTFRGAGGELQYPEKKDPPA